MSKIKQSFIVFTLLAIPLLFIQCKSNAKNERNINYEILEHHNLECAENYSIEEQYGFGCAEQYINYIYTNKDWLNRDLLENLDISSLDLNNESALNKDQINSVITNFMRDWVDESLDEINGFNEDMNLESGLGLGFESHRKYALAYSHKQYFAVSYLNYYWSGGAHGMYQERILLYDVDKKLRLNLRDILKDNSSEELLSNLLLDAFITQANPSEENPYSLQVKEYYEDNTTELLENNFYFTNKGIHFLYPPYTLAPYSDGIITLTLDFGLLNNIIEEKYINDFNDFAEQFSLQTNTEK